MKITSSQLKRIIKEEVTAAQQSGSSKRRRRLFENSAAEDLRDAAEALEDACVAGAGAIRKSDVMGLFEIELYEHLASVLISHRVVSSRFTAKMLMEELADLENDSLAHAERQIISDITAALAAYADSIALLVPQVVNMDDLEDEVESPDKLLPEF